MELIFSTARFLQYVYHLTRSFSAFAANRSSREVRIGEDDSISMALDFKTDGSRRPRFSSCQITIDARTWRRSGERQGGTPFSTILELVRWSCQQSSSSSGVYNGCCSTTIGNYDLSEYCLLANSNFPGHNFICSNVLLDAWKPPTDNLVYSTDPNVGVNILTYNSHTVIFELILHASHAAMMFTAEGQRCDFFITILAATRQQMFFPRKFLTNLKVEQQI